MPISNNVNFHYPNLGFSEIENAFYNFNYVDKIILKKNSSGNLQATYPIVTSLGNLDLINPIISLKVTGYRFEYAFNKSNAHFWSLEKHALGVTIRRFKLEGGIVRYCTTRTNGYGTLVDEWNFVNSSDTSYDINAFSVEYKNTILAQGASAGSSSAFFQDVTTLIKGARVVLGPSGEGNHDGLVEEVIVSSFNTNTGEVFFETPLVNSYISNDEVVFHTNILLFDNNAPGPSIGSGMLYRLSATTGRPLGLNSGGQFANIMSAVYSPDQERTLVCRGNQVLYYNSSTNTFSRSIMLNNTLEQHIGTTPVHDLAVSSTSLYRLQTQALDSNGLLYSFSGPGVYNYVITTLLPQVTCATVVPQRHVIFGSDADPSYIDVHVTDQYGVPVANTQVRIRVVGDEAGTFIAFGSGQDYISPADKMTNDNGNVKFAYRSGENINTDITNSPCQLIVTLVAVSKEFSSLVFQRKYLKRKNYFKQKAGRSDSNYVRQRASRISKGIIQRHLKKFGFPALRGAANTRGTVLASYADFHDGLRDIDWSYWINKHQANNFQGASPVTGVAHFSLKQRNATVSKTALFFQKTLSRTGKIIQDTPLHVEHSRLKQVTTQTSTGTLYQVNLIDEIIPFPFSEKNAIDTNIYIRLNDPGFPIDESSIRLYVNHIDVTALSSVGEDALPAQTEIFYDPQDAFDFTQRVYVLLTFYDTAPETPNFYDISYYFDITPDYRAPVLFPIYPAKGEVDVSIDTPISFNIVDYANEVELDSIRLYIDSVLRSPLEVAKIPNGYYVYFKPDTSFCYKQDVSVCVTASDIEGNDMITSYRFYTKPGHPPIITEVSPENCAKLIHRDEPTIFEIYSDGDGVDLNTIRVIIGGRDRRFLVSPSIRRII
jgi:hypothetical protein